MRAVNMFLGLIASKLVRGYQLFISPLLPPACRYYPTCSEYSRVAFERHGFVYGFYLTAARILRCNPWSLGGFDPVPPLKGSTPDDIAIYQARDKAHNRVENRLRKRDR